MTQTTVSPPVSAEAGRTSEPAVASPRRRWAILAALCLALMTVMMANSGLNLALPSLAVDVHLTSTQQTWAVEVYSLLFAGLLFTCGAVGDRFGRKRIMQIGLLVFIAAAAYAALFVQSGTTLILSRALMGVGGAMIMPTTLSIINATFPAGQRARAIAIWTAVAGSGVALGSVVSGVLIEAFSWHSLFWLSAGLGAVALVASQLLVVESRDPSQTRIDVRGGVLSAVGLVAVVYAITEGSSKGFSDPTVLACLAGGVSVLLLFVVWQLRCDHPMLDVRLFRSRRFSVSTVAMTLLYFAMMGVMFAMSQLLQLVLGFSALQSALAMIPMMVPMMIVGPLVPDVQRAIGDRWTVACGLGVVALGFFALTRLGGSPSYPEVLVAMVIVSTGIALSSTPATNLMMAAVPQNRSGMGSAMNDTTRELGGALGVAVLGSMISSAYASNIGAALQGVSDDVAAAASSSLAAAVDAAGSAGLTDLADAARAAWMDGLHSATSAGMLLCLAASLVAAAFLPRRRRSQAHA